MMHNNHLKTNVAAGVAASSFFVTDAKFLLAMLFITFGSIVGHYLGPDLDIDSSIPNKNGGKQIILVTFSLLLILDYGINLSTILISIISVLLLILKRQGMNKKNQIKDIEFFNYLPIVLGIFYLVQVFFMNNILVNSSTYFLIFAIIMIKHNPHRGPTHSLLMMGLVIISVMLLPIPNGITSITITMLILGYCVGFLTHLLMDVLGSKSMQLFYPSKKMVKPLRLYTVNTYKETLVSYMFLFICIGIIIANIKK